MESLTISNNGLLIDTKIITQYLFISILSAQEVQSSWCELLLIKSECYDKYIMIVAIWFKQLLNGDQFVTNL